MAAKKVAQTVIKEDKFYTISAANGKVVEVADYNIDHGARVQLWDNANAEWQQWGFVRAGEGRLPHQEPFHRQDAGPVPGRRRRRHRCPSVGRRPRQQPAVDR